MWLDFDDVKRGFAIFSFKFDTKTRIRLWRKLSKQIGDGIPIVPSLIEQRDIRGSSDPFYYALNEWSVIMKNGKQFSEAVRDWVSNEEAMILSAGEASGDISSSLNSVIKITNAKDETAMAVYAGIAYPSFLVLLSFGMLYFFNYKIIPMFAAAVKGAAWTGMAKLVVDTSDWAKTWLHWVALLFVLMLVAFYVSLPRWSSGLRTMFDRYAPYSVYRVMHGSAWLIALAGLIKAGVRIDTAMEKLARHASPWSRERIAAALRGIRSGRSLGDALHRTGYEFPDKEIISDIRIYSTKSGLETALESIGNEWISESVRSIKQIMSMIFGLSIVMVTVILAFELGGILTMQMQMSQLMQR